MNRLIWLGWGGLGLSGLLMLLLQVSLAVGGSVLGAISDPALMQVITGTRYGALWLARMLLWLLLGVELFFGTARKNHAFYWLALAFGGALLLTNSLFSHASAAQDSAAAVLSDWLHLSMTALWIGGLVQFINIFGPVRRRINPDLPTLDSLVGYFSQFARVVVAGLLLTGLYAAWLQVGSVEALFTTLYGQVLLVKLILILGLLGFAAINLLFTHRGLQAGRAIWAGRLRGLITAELTLAVSVLAAVGALTSLTPARTVLAQHALAAAPPPANPILDTQVSDGLHVQLLITPGWVGQNTFTLTLSDDQGKPVTDVSLIRLRFTDQTANLGESELRIQPSANGVLDGTYSVSGANLSQAGTWRLRVTVQRPVQYDALVDFKPQMGAAPPPPEPVNAEEALPYRVPALLIAGALALALGAFFSNQSRPLSGARLLSQALLVAGVVFLASGVAAFASGRESRSEATPQPTDIQISLETPLDQAVVGKTTLVVLVHDSEHQPIDDAQIEVTGDMTHAGMTPAFGKAEKGQQGRYEVPFEWTMGGDWILTVKASLPDGREAQQTFRLTVKAQ